MARYTLPSPQKKMIIILYIPLIVMLAINTTSDSQKREKHHREEELNQLTEAFNEQNKQIEQKKREEKQEIMTKEDTDTAGALIINDRPEGLTKDGQLPSPTSYLRCTASNVYRGNVPVKRSRLLAATEIGASIAEPKMEYKVISFVTILIKENGKQISILQTEGNKLTLEQKMQIAQLEEGDAFYITSILLKGADGQKFQSNPINVIVLK